MTIKIALAQINILPGHPGKNAALMLEYIEKARQSMADIVVFPKLSIPGRLPGDLWSYDYFLRECEEAGQTIVAASRGLIVVYGNIVTDRTKKNTDGRAGQYSARLIAQDGRLLPDDLAALPELSVKGYKFSGDDILLYISAQPFVTGNSAKRHRFFSALAAKKAAPLIYVNNVGLENNGKNIYACDGASCVYDHSGILVAAATPFREELLFYDFNPPARAKAAPRPQLTDYNETQEIYSALHYAASHFLKNCGISRMVIGLSGGIDSAVAAAFYAHILGQKNVLLLNMPSRYNSPKTINLAEMLAANLAVPYAQVPIEESVALTKKQIEGINIDGAPLALSPLALENIQARDRSGRLLAAAAAAFGGAFSCNANKSELAVGYGTFYGDLAGALALLGDLWKYQVYALGCYLNEKIHLSPVIPEEIFTIRPSAELSAAQTVGAGGDPLYYPYHDYLLKAFVEQRVSPVEIAGWYQGGMLAENIGCAPGLPEKLFPAAADFFADLEHWWLAFTGFSAAKRIQAPPVIAISKRPLGREAQLPARLPEKYLRLKTVCT